MIIDFILALLAFSSLTAASDPGCDELIKPLEDRAKVYGEWMFYSVASDSEDVLKAFQIVNSSRVKFSPISGTDEFTMHYAERIDGNCNYGSANSTTSGNATSVTFHYNSTSIEHVGRYLETCPDCVLWSDEMVMEGNGVTKKSRNLFLFTKTQKLDASQLEVFNKQAKCLNLLMDFYFPDTAGLCPEETKSITEVKADDQ